MATDKALQDAVDKEAATRAAQTRTAGERAKTPEELKVEQDARIAEEDARQAGEAAREANKTPEQKAAEEARAAQVQEQAKGAKLRPPIGCKVWVWSGGQSGHSILDPTQAMDGTVLYVSEDGKATIAVRDHAGNTSTIKDVEVREANDTGAHGPEDSQEVFATPVSDEKTTKASSRANAGGKLPQATGTTADQSKPEIASRQAAGAPSSGGTGAGQTAPVGGAPTGIGGTQAPPGGAQPASANTAKR